MKGKTEKEKNEIEQKELNPLNVKLSENQDKYVENQKLFSRNQEKGINSLFNLSKDELEKMSFDIGTKISKCNMVASNLMKGLSWNSVEIKLDNWENKKFTSKEKVAEKAKKAKQVEERSNIEDKKETKKEDKQSAKNEKTEDDEKINTKIASKQSEQENKIDDYEEKIIKETEKELKEDKSMVEQSEFAKKHPKLAKALSFVKSKWNNFIGKNKKTEEKEEIKENEQVKDSEEMEKTRK